MRQWLDSDLELLVETGFVYLPLMFDPEIEKEIQSLSFKGAREIYPVAKTQTIIEVEGRHFIKSLSLDSLVENYEKFHPASYAQLRRACLEKFDLNAELTGITVGLKLKALVFQVMPHFIRRDRGLDRRKLKDAEILELIGKKVNVPEDYYEQANKFLDIDALRGILDNLEKHGTTLAPPQEGLLSALELRTWFHQALEVKIVDREKGRLRQALQEQEQFLAPQRQYLGLLRYIAENGGLEVDGFGFVRLGGNDEYLIYKHTGEYALKDYYGRLYLFPDCRVAVSSTGSLKPVVLESYKHPFLFGHDSGQEICIRDFNPPRFAADNVIHALEEGINALFYGYNSRRRNGYHSLDRITPHSRSVDFDDYRIPNDHPKIISGQVEIKNRYI